MGSGKGLPWPFKRPTLECLPTAPVGFPSKISRSTDPFNAIGTKRLAENVDTVGSGVFRVALMGRYQASHRIRALPSSARP